MTPPKYKMNVVARMELDGRVSLRRLKEILRGNIAHGESINTTEGKIKIRETLSSQIRYGIKWRYYYLIGHIRGYFDRKDTQTIIPNAIIQAIVSIIILIIGYFLGKL